MSNDLRRVSAGDQFYESASFRNAVVDVLERFNRDRTVGFRTQDAVKDFPTPKVKSVFLLNTRGAIIEQYSVVGIGDATIGPQVNEYQFRNVKLLNSASPSASARFAIATESAPDDGVFSAVICDVVQVKINRTSTAHNFANPANANYDNLVSATTGTAEILWIDDLPAAAIGETVHEGSGAPSGGTGSDGDYYKDTSGEEWYGPKTAGAWGSAHDYGTGICWAVVVMDQAAETYAFKTIAVSGQSDVVADSATDTLTLAAGSNIAITTNASTDTVTFAVTGLPSATTINSEIGPAFVIESADGTIDITIPTSAHIDLSAREADATHSGILSLSAQDIVGDKTFSDDVIIESTLEVDNTSEFRDTAVFTAVGFNFPNPDICFSEAVGFGVDSVGGDYTAQLLLPSSSSVAGIFRAVMHNLDLVTTTNFCVASNIYGSLSGSSVNTVGRGGIALSQSIDLSLASVSAWSGSSVAYTAAISIVTNGGSYYRCIKDHSSGAGSEPGTGVNWATYWNVLSPSGSVAIVAPVVSVSDNAGSIRTGFTGFMLGAEFVSGWMVDPGSGVITVPSGGTGATSFTAGGLIVGDGTDPLSSLATSRTVGGNLQLKLASDSWIEFGEASF